MSGDQSFQLWMSILPTVAAIGSAFALWIRSKSMQREVSKNSRKIDDNTAITVEAKDAAQLSSALAHPILEKIEKQTCCVEADQRIGSIITTLQEHETRIISLESHVQSIKASVESVSRNVDSTRHEMRGHLQSVVNKIDLLGMKGQP